MRMFGTKVHIVDQVHRLRGELAEAGVEHGQSAIVTIRNVKIEGPVVRMCFIRGVEVNQVTGESDGAPLPSKASIVGQDGNLLRIRHGCYDVEGLLVHTNGTIKMVATPKTRFKRVPTV